MLSFKLNIYLCLGAFGTSFFLFLVGFVGCNHILAVTYISLSVGFIGFQASGSLISHLDIASNYAGEFEIKIVLIKIKNLSLGTLMGITNMLAAIPGFVGPMFVGWITNHNVNFYLEEKKRFTYLFVFHSKH